VSQFFAKGGRWHDVSYITTIIFIRQPWSTVCFRGRSHSALGRVGKVAVVDTGQTFARELA
jgi:hypothetical protein